MRKLLANLHFLARNHQPISRHAEAQPLSESRAPSDTLCIRPSRPALETLPAELRAHILSFITDPSDLKALVHASPVFHQQYLLDRWRLLGQALSAALESVLVDAYMLNSMTALAIATREMSGQDAQQAMTRLFREYDAELRAATGATTVLQRCSTDDLADIACFYLSVVRPVSCSCTTLFLENLKGLSASRSLSRQERARLLRALYRFQFYQDLHGYLAQAPRSVKGGVFGAFFAIFHPWEVEEMHCIEYLLRGVCDRIFPPIKWHLYKKMPDKTERALRIDGVVAQGLKAFRQVLETADRKGLVKDLMQRTWRLDRPTPSSLGWVTLIFDRRHYRLSDGLERDTYELLPFSGDKEDGPPSAWVVIWQGTYGNIYDEVLPSSVKAWGYVFWDAQRLDESEAMQEVQRAFVFR